LPGGGTNRRHDPRARRVASRNGSPPRNFAPTATSRRGLRTADRPLVIGVGNDAMFARLCHALGHPEWADDPDFINNGSRVRNRTRLATLIEGVMSGQPRQHWLSLLDAAEIPCGPINDYAQVFSDPQVAARGMVLETDHPALGSLRTLGSPIKMSATPADASRRAPLLGEHTDEVLTQFGLSADDIAALRRSGAVA